MKSNEDWREESQETLSLLEQADRIRARSDLETFVTELMPNYILNWHNRELMARLSRLRYEKNQRIIIEMPPRTGKSLIVSTFFPAWYLGVHPSHEVVGVSYSASLASSLNVDAQEIMSHPTYKEIFPNSTIPTLGEKNDKRKKRRQNLVELLNDDGSLYSVGSGGTLTGRGSHLLIADDLYKDLAQAYSETQRKKVSNWFKAVARTRVYPGGNVIIMFTRWHMNDLCGELLKAAEEDEEATQWERITFPMISESVRDELDHREEEGEELWPEYFTGGQDMINKLKKDVGSVVWNALYQQRPSAQGGNMVLDKDFRYWNQETLPVGTIEYSWDLDFGSIAEGSSYVVGQVWLSGVDGNFYLLDQFRKRVKFTGQIQAIKNMINKWGEGNACNIENKANGAAAIQTLSGETDAEIIPLEPNGDKEARFVAITPLFEANRIFLPDVQNDPDTYSWVEEYKKELMEFPASENDDQVDATSQILAKWYDPMEAIDGMGGMGSLEGASKWALF